MQSKKPISENVIRVLIAILFLGLGLAIGLLSNTKRKVTHFEFQELSLDSIQSINDTTTMILTEKNKGKFDSLKALGKVRDSLLIVKGKLSSTMILLVKKPDEYNRVDSVRSNIDQMISSIDEIIMSGTLDLLKPTNETLKALIKDIKEKTVKLQKIATTVGTISDIIKAIIDILSLPILAPVSPPATVS